MFFFLSKLIDFVFSPVNWIVFLFVISFLSKSPSKRRKFSLYGFITLLFFTNPFLLNLGLILIPSPSNNIDLNKNQKADIALVLGGLTSYDDSKDQVYFNSNINRLTKAIELYKTKKVAKIFITGGSGSVTYPEKGEASLLKKYISTYFNIPSKDILIENKSNNTHENAKFTNEILVKKQLISKKIILITSNIHQYRAQKCFSKEGVKTYISTNSRSKSREKWLPKNFILPQSDNLSNWDNILHEIVGIITYKFMGYI